MQSSVQLKLVNTKRMNAESSCQAASAAAFWYPTDLLPPEFITDGARSIQRLSIPGLGKAVTN